MTTRIGIDPDCQASGVATMHDGKLISLKRMDFFHLIDHIKFNKSAIYSVEDVSYLQPVFQRFRKNGITRLNETQMLKIAQNVGMVKMLGRLIVKKLEMNQCEFELVKPLKGAIKHAKKDRKYFNLLMNYNGSSGEDTRDAAILLHRYLKEK